MLSCGPQTFLGYVNDPAATAKTISRDGFLYTGDLGYKDAAGLHLTGREKWVIKSLGYQIFPGDVEAHICALTAQVANCVVVGVAHEVVSEAVVALVEKRPGVELSPRNWIVTRVPCRHTCVRVIGSFSNPAACR